MEKIFEIVTEIDEQGTSILLVEQNALMALDVASRGYVLETGTIALEGPAPDEGVRKTYLGETNAAPDTRPRGNRSRRRAGGRRLYTWPSVGGTCSLTRNGK